MSNNLGTPVCEMSSRELRTLEFPPNPYGWPCPVANEIKRRSKNRASRFLKWCRAAWYYLREHYQWEVVRTYKTGRKWRMDPESEIEHEVEIRVYRHMKRNIFIEISFVV